MAHILFSKANPPASGEPGTPKLPAPGARVEGHTLLAGLRGSTQQLTLPVLELGSVLTVENNRGAHKHLAMK